jgi:hypothetical protein
MEIVSADGSQFSVFACRTIVSEKNWASKKVFAVLQLMVFLRHTQFVLFKSFELVRPHTAAVFRDRICLSTSH